MDNRVTVINKMLKVLEILDEYSSLWKTYAYTLEKNIEKPINPITNEEMSKISYILEVTKDEVPIINIYFDIEDDIVSEDAKFDCFGLMTNEEVETLNKYNPTLPMEPSLIIDRLKAYDVDNDSYWTASEVLNKINGYPKIIDITSPFFSDRDDNKEE